MLQRSVEVNNELLERGSNSIIGNSKVEQLHKLCFLYSTTEETKLKIMEGTGCLKDMRGTLESFKHFPLKISR